MKNKCVHCFKAISVKARFDIFNFLLKQKDGVTVSRLTEFTSLRQPTVSFHIDKLEKTGLVKKYKKGREVYCKVNSLCPNCPLI